MQQVFAKSPELADELAFERKLFVIGKLAHTAIRAANSSSLFLKTSRSLARSALQAHLDRINQLPLRVIASLSEPDVVLASMLL